MAAARVLIIEDHPASLDLMQYLLRASGYDTLAAADGREGIGTARREHPDLILCDMQLPGADGYEVARSLRDDPATRGIPLLAVTALSMVGDRDKILAAGFDGYFSKPIEPETFVTHMEQHLPQALRVGH